ncbi:hypothetical protein ACSBR2_020038 [Camellia fascicularis]
MSKSGAFDLATGVGGKIEKKEVLSAVEKYIYFPQTTLCSLIMLCILPILTLLDMGIVLVLHCLQIAANPVFKR